MKKEKQRILILTDGCFWEKNKLEGTAKCHSIEVCDQETGQIFFIKNGAKIVLVEGQTRGHRTQESYNKTP